MQNSSETMVLLGTALVSKNKDTDAIFPNSRLTEPTKERSKSSLIKSSALL
jgi:hypothetical protein